MEREERKKCFIKDFMKAFSENGIDRTSIKKLAKAADMNEASIYQYFKNKDDIIIECVQQYFENIKTELFPVVADTSKPAKERLDCILNYSKEDSDCGKFVYQVLANPSYSRLCTPVAADFIKGLRTLGKDLSVEFGIDEKITCPVLFLFYSAILASSILNDRAYLQAQMDFLKQLLKNSLPGKNLFQAPNT